MTLGLVLFALPHGWLIEALIISMELLGERRCGRIQHDRREPDEVVTDGVGADPGKEGLCRCTETAHFGRHDFVHDLAPIGEDLVWQTQRDSGLSS